MITLITPPGIGDISWVYSKVSKLALEREITFSLCQDSVYGRGLPFVSLLPNVRMGVYTNISYVGSLHKLLKTSTDLKKLKDNATYHISLNPHLESGKKLAEAFPAQATEYHYGLKLPPVSPQDPWFLKFQQDKRIKIGLYCSCSKHREEILHWSVKEWVSFFLLVKEAVGDVLFVVIGAKYDDRTNIVAEELKRTSDVIVCMNQHIGQTINIMKHMDYFFAFPSGLGIVADVIGVPAMMWFWGNLPSRKKVSGLFDTYADPAHVASGFHLTAPYASVEDSFKLFLERGLRHVGERYVCTGP